MKTDSGGRRSEGRRGKKSASFPIFYEKVSVNNFHRRSSPAARAPARDPSDAYYIKKFLWQFARKKTGWGGGGGIYAPLAHFFFGGGKGRRPHGHREKKTGFSFLFFSLSHSGGNGKPIGREVIWEGEVVVGWLVGGWVAPVAGGKGDPISPIRY